MVIYQLFGIKLSKSGLELPKELGEFVIVHELVHILAPNHGKVFKCFMDAYLPNWLELENVLLSPTATD